jgi:hypothetical protein
MTLARCCFLYVLTLWSVLLGPAWLAAQESAAPRVARLIRQLGSPDFARREAAGRELVRLGPRSEPRLTEALADDDYEIRLRARDLLRRLEIARLWSGGLVEYHAEQAPLGEVLAELARQSGTQLRLADDARLAAKRVTVDFCDTPFWQAADALCRQTQTAIRPRRGGLMLVSAPPHHKPTARAGPLRAQISSVRRVAAASLDDEPPTLELGVELIWQDRFRLLARQSRPAVVRAVTDTGESLPVSASGGDGWNLVVPGSRQVAAVVRLPATSARRLAELTLRWNLIAVGGMTTLDLRDLTPGTPHRRDDLTVTLETLGRQPDGRHAASLIIARDLAAPHPREILLHENQVELFAADGAPFSLVSHTPSLTDQGVRLRLVFQPSPDATPPHQLRVHYPRLRVRRGVEIAFRDVPLTAAAHPRE